MGVKYCNFSIHQKAPGLDPSILGTGFKSKPKWFPRKPSEFLVALVVKQ